MRRKIIPDIVQTQAISDLPPAASACDAAKLMNERNIGAILVMENGVLKGIFTERDLARRVVAAGRDPDRTLLSEVMTPDPDTLAPGDTAAAALERMRLRGYRHLPVVENGKVISMVSIRDLYAAVQIELEDDLKAREEMMFGAGYGITS